MSTVVYITDGGSTASTTSPADVINNTFAFNTVGLYLNNTSSTPLQAYVASNIFWENHDQTNARNGFAIFSTNPDKITLQNNMFFGNGASDTSQANATNDLGNGFSPALLGPLAANAESNLGNFTGNPAFSYPVDPRPGSDGPANFFISADYSVDSSLGGNRQRLGSDGDPNGLARQLPGHDPGHRVRPARLRTSRRGCIRVRGNHRRHQSRSVASSAWSQPRWFPTPAPLTPTDRP